MIQQKYYWCSILCLFFLIQMSVGLAQRKEKAKVSLITRCDIKQVRLHLVAVNAMGMSQTVSVYAINNVGKKDCYLPTHPVVWVLGENKQRRPLSVMPLLPHLKNQSIQLAAKPTANSVLMKHLVWFAIKANSATYPGDKNYLYPFSRIKVGLFDHRLGLKKVDYQGYTSAAEVTAFHAGLAEWGFGRQCLAHYQSLTDNTSIKFNQILNCH